MGRGIEIHNGFIAIPATELLAGVTYDSDGVIGTSIGISVAATATVKAVLIGLHIVNIVESQPAGGYYGIRFSEHGPATITIGSLLMFYVPRADVKYFLEITICDKTGYSAVGNKAVDPAGWLKVLAGTEDRYLQLYRGP